MRVIHWQVNAFKHLFPFVLSMLLLLSGSDVNSQMINSLNLDTEKLESSVSVPEPIADMAPLTSALESAPVNSAIAASPHQDMTATQPAAIAADLPTEDSKVTTSNYSLITELLVGEQPEQ